MARQFSSTFSLPKSSEPVIGNLGGAPVSVPINYTFLMTEYDGDPNVFAPERRQWTPPVRTYASRINSLALTVHLPDFAPRTVENEASYYRSRRTFGEPEEWLEIGVSAGKNFLVRDEVLKTGRIYDRERIIEGFAGPVNPIFKEIPRHVSYRRQAELRHGLIEYRPIGFPEDAEANLYNYRLFFHEVDGGDVTFIKCLANGSPFEGSPRNDCTHEFITYPEIRAEVSLSYDARSLHRWMEYESRARRLILDFRVQPDG